MRLSIPPAKGLSSPLTRREFLKLGLFGLVISACQKLDIPMDTPYVPVSTTTQLPNRVATVEVTTTQTLFSSPTEPSVLIELTPTKTATAHPSASNPVFMIDGHQDIAWNALEFDRNPLQSAFSVRKQEASTGITEVMGTRTTGLPEWITGRIGIIFATLFVMPASRAYKGWNKVTYTTPEQARTRAWEQLTYYHQLAKQESHLQLITSLSDLKDVISAWQKNDVTQEKKVGLVLLMEGADPIVTPADLLSWFDAGLRIVGLAWGRTRYSGGTGQPGPLTKLGKQLLSSMAELDMTLDLSHMAEVAYLEALEIYPGSVIASHSNPHAFLPTDRGLSDEMILKLAARDGVVGIVPYNRYLKPGWGRGNPRESVTLDTVADAIDYVVQLVGSSRHVAIGSDFDGGFGLESIPNGMDSVADLIKIADLLKKRGYETSDVEAVMNGNWLRILRRSLPLRN